MKKFSKVILRFLLAFLFLIPGQSCVFNLKEDTDSIFPINDLQSDGDILAALIPIYRKFGDIIAKPHFYEISGYGADDITTWWAGNKASIRVFDRFDYGDSENADNNWLTDVWDRYWKVIYYANTLIEELKTSSASDEIIKTAEAEARFFRAISYFHLVRNFGNMPIVLDGELPTAEEPRASVLENYKIIESDLIIAESGLPDPGNVDQIGRVSKAVAKSLLADLYITWAGWPVKDESKYQLAAEKAKEIIAMNYYELMPIEKLWLEESSNSLESIFAVQYSKSENIHSWWPSANSFHEARGWSDMYPERQFFYDFPEGPRKVATFLTEIPQRDAIGGVIVTKDPPIKSWQESQRDHPMYKKFTVSEDLTVGTEVSGFRATEIYRYAEVLLIYAEASAHTNGGMAGGDALEAFNQVRRRAAGLPYDQINPETDLNAVSVDEIVAERAWELAGEFKRWHDLVRLEKVAEVAAHRDLTEEVMLSRSPAEITWKQYIAPIPTSAILTSELVQNPEGFKVRP